MKKLLLLALTLVGYNQINADFTTKALEQLPQLQETISQAIEGQLRKNKTLARDLTFEAHALFRSLKKNGEIIQYNTQDIQRFLDAEYGIMADRISETWMAHIGATLHTLVKTYQKRGPSIMVPYRGYHPNELLMQASLQRSALVHSIADMLRAEYREVNDDLPNHGKKRPFPWTDEQVTAIGNSMATGTIRTLARKAMLRSASLPLQAAKHTYKYVAPYPRSILNPFQIL